MIFLRLDGQMAPEVLDLVPLPFSPDPQERPDAIETSDIVRSRAASDPHQRQ